MTIPKALLYSPKQRWRFWAAFGVAVLIHLAAIAVAQSRPTELPPVASAPPAEITFTPENDVAPPPPEEIEAPAPTLSQQTDESTIPEEHPTPPPVQRPTDKRVQPIVRNNVSGLSRVATLQTARVFAVNAPRPEYPYEARRQRVTGSGVAILSIAPTGNVTQVTMLQSTGSATLDNATLAAFRRWRFKPGTAATVRTPITYTLTGATY
jgi:protein TonB